jgi:hypothetical protein
LLIDQRPALEALVEHGHAAAEGIYHVRWQERGGGKQPHSPACQGASTASRRARPAFA